MWFARSTDSTLVKATPNAGGTCPNCAEEVIARCGQLISWHWAHLPTSAYAPGGGGPESCWHAWYKSQFPEAWREQSHGHHRADIRTPNGLTIEVQSGPLKQSQVRAREAAWDHLIWFYYAIPELTDDDEEPDAVPGGRGERWPDRDKPSFWFSHKPAEVLFWWRRPRSDALWSRAPVILDIGFDRCLRVKTWPTDTGPGSAERISGQSRAARP